MRRLRPKVTTSIAAFVLLTVAALLCAGCGVSTDPAASATTAAAAAAPASGAEGGGAGASPAAASASQGGQSSAALAPATLEELVFWGNAVVLGTVKELLPVRWATASGQRDAGPGYEEVKQPDGQVVVRTRNYPYQPAVLEVERFVVAPHRGPSHRERYTPADDLLPSSSTREISIFVEANAPSDLPTLSAGEHVLLSLSGPRYFQGADQPLWSIVAKWVIADTDEAEVRYPPDYGFVNRPRKEPLTQLTGDIARIAADQERGATPVPGSDFVPKQAPAPEVVMTPGPATPASGPTPQQADP